MRRMYRVAASAAAILILPLLGAGPASAQLFSDLAVDVLWDWGGGKVVNDSGREVVRFDPQFGPGTVVVSFGDRRLYFVTQPGEAISYPIAIPREEDRWEGMTTVTNKRENPSWTPTPSMVAENPKLPRWVPGGHPMNPLGVRALYLGSSTYRIHGTDAPWTIGTAVSKGCIRMYNRDVMDLYPRVALNAKVVVTWERFGKGTTPEYAASRSSSPASNATWSPTGSSTGGPSPQHGKLRPIDQSDLPPLR